MWIDWRKISSETHIIHEKGRKELLPNIIWWRVPVKFLRFAPRNARPWATTSQPSKGKQCSFGHIWPQLVTHTHTSCGTFSLWRSLRQKIQSLPVLFSSIFGRVEASDIEDSRRLSWPTKCESPLVLRKTPGYELGDHQRARQIPVNTYHQSIHWWPSWPFLFYKISPEGLTILDLRQITIFHQWSTLTYVEYGLMGLWVRYEKGAKVQKSGYELQVTERSPAEKRHRPVRVARVHLF